MFKVEDLDETRAPLLDHLIELRNLVTVAELIVESALARQESRGLHYTLDHPRAADTLAPTILPGRA